MHRDPQTRDELKRRLTLLIGARQTLSTTPAEQIPDSLSHVLALSALDSDIANYEAALAGGIPDA